MAEKNWVNDGAILVCLGNIKTLSDTALQFKRLWMVVGSGTALACGAFGAASGNPGGAVLTAVFLASLGGSIGGFAFSALCGVVLFGLGTDPVRAVQIMLICSIANQAVMTWWVRRDIDWRGLRIFLMGGVLGLPLGLWLLLRVDHHLYIRALGVLLMAYGCYMLIRAPATVRVQHPGLDLFAGALSGITGAAAAFPSAAVTVWCSFKGWDRARQRGVFQPFILIMQIASLIAIGIVTHTSRMQSAGLTLNDLLCVPVGLLGTFAGLAVYQRISTRQFGVALNLLLIVAGVSFLM
jgi:uncharacterized membrane protein YfcA